MKLRVSTRSYLRLDHFHTPRTFSTQAILNSSRKTKMSLAPDTPDQPPNRPAMTPGGIATELSKLDLPAPTNLRLNLPTSHKHSQPPSVLSPIPASAVSDTTADTGDISGPEPEAITEMRRKTRSESMSEQLSATLADMRLPQPERIFGPEEGTREKSGKQGVSAEDWDRVKLADEVPEAVKEPVRMTHSRNTSRA